uniref:Tc1-like transposase DDE domain-containing protein n=1 Tax=Acrobeloides nanus TaxID=290746 RepID=A0A914CPG6_9BILA
MMLEFWEFPFPKHLWFMQDGAPLHKAEETQNLIRDNVPEFIEVDVSPQRDNGEWSPNSPDLNVMSTAYGTSWRPRHAQSPTSQSTH